MKTKKAILVIMDGWGLGQVKYADAIQHANVPFVTSLYQYPNTTLITCGEAVGLPDGQMGNSEVGHLYTRSYNVFMLQYVMANLQPIKL